ncbi:hypothetical protein EVA_19153, partial [gut metagenome]
AVVSGLATSGYEMWYSYVDGSLCVVGMDYALF